MADNVAAAPKRAAEIIVALRKFSIALSLERESDRTAIGWRAVLTASARIRVAHFAVPEQAQTSTAE